MYCGVPRCRVRWSIATVHRDAQHCNTGRLMILYALLLLAYPHNAVINIQRRHPPRLPDVFRQGITDTWPQALVTPFSPRILGGTLAGALQGYSQTLRPSLWVGASRASLGWGLQRTLGDTFCGTGTLGWAPEILGGNLCLTSLKNSTPGMLAETLCTLLTRYSAGFSGAGHSRDTQQDSVLASLGGGTQAGQGGEEHVDLKSNNPTSTVLEHENENSKEEWIGIGHVNKSYFILKSMLRSQWERSACSSIYISNWIPGRMCYVPCVDLCIVQDVHSPRGTSTFPSK